jgi:hypothetical protein
MRRLTLITLAAFLASAAVADAAVYDIPRVLRADLGKVAKRTDLPVRLPARMSLDYGDPLFGSGRGAKKEYELEVAATDPCGANACFLARFAGEEGGTPAFKRTVALANGITGHYKPLTCGGSCSPPMIEWVQGGVLYSIQAKLGVSGRKRQRRAMVRAANSAIRATPR